MPEFSQTGVIHLFFSLLNARVKCGVDKSLSYTS